MMKGRAKTPKAPKATPKPHQCDIKATSKRVDSQAIGTPLRPQCDPKATPKPGHGDRPLSQSIGHYANCFSHPTNDGL
jgi:hypothetical protein